MAAGFSGGSSTGVLVTDARRIPVLPVASGSAARLSADEGRDGENVDDAKYEAGKEENDCAGSAGNEVLAGEVLAGGGGADTVTISDCRQASSVIAVRAIKAARVAARFPR